MVHDAFEQGPIINTYVPEFQLPDHNRVMHTRIALMGEHGMLLGFIGDIWQPASVRRILWLQRHVGKFALMGTPVAVLVRDHANTLYGFQMSSPLPVPFPLLADVEGKTHELYHMETQAGLILIDRYNRVHQKWLMLPEYVWPKLQDIVDEIQVMRSVKVS
jgi:peroxiredoxin